MPPSSELLRDVEAQSVVEDVRSAAVIAGRARERSALRHTPDAWASASGRKVWISRCAALTTVGGAAAAAVGAAGRATGGATAGVAAAAATTTTAGVAAAAAIDVINGGDVGSR